MRRKRNSSRGVSYRVSASLPHEPAFTINKHNVVSSVITLRSNVSTDERCYGEGSLTLLGEYMVFSGHGGRMAEIDAKVRAPALMPLIKDRCTGRNAVTIFLQQTIFLP